MPRFPASPISDEQLAQVKQRLSGFARGRSTRKTDIYIRVHYVRGLIARIEEAEQVLELCGEDPQNAWSIAHDYLDREAPIEENPELASWD
jgi:hypothetical protein